MYVSAYQVYYGMSSTDQCTGVTEDNAQSLDQAGGQHSHRHHLLDCNPECNKMMYMSLCYSMVKKSMY